MRKFLSLCIACAVLVAQSPAQQSPIRVDRPGLPIPVRSYAAPSVPPIQTGNSGHLHSLIRAGKLYITVQDAIALAIEGNLDLEIDRYGPLAAKWELVRAQAGGPLRGVTGGNSVVNQVTSGLGVVGSEVSAGLANGNNGNGGGSGGAVVSQIGPITPNLDPVLQNTTAFSHQTTPQPNTVVSQTDALVDTRHQVYSFVQQGLLSGGFVQVTANETYLKENAPTDVLNPAVAPVVQLYVRHWFLNGFGTNVNGRFIHVAQKNLGLAQETFRSQLLNLVANVLNLYWDLVSDNNDLKARQSTLNVAQKFYDDTKREIELGVIARFEISRAEAELETRKREISISEAAVRQQENLLKNMLSRNGLGDPMLDAAEIVPLDSIQVPEQDELPPLRDLVATAMAKRPDVAISKISVENAEISSLGTVNGLLPSLGTIVATGANGLSGTPTPQPPGAGANPYFAGGLGNALAQVFRRDFPSERVAVYAQGIIGNRQAQGDYGFEQVQLRQNDLITRRTMNQLVVDISNQVIALRQARSRYSTATNTRALQAQLLEKEQQKFSLGASTLNDLITAQRSLATARTAEVVAQGAYSRARVGLDQVLGETLEKNNVVVSQALAEH